MEDRDQDWMADPFHRVIELDRDRDGDAWAHSLGQALTDAVGATGTRASWPGKDGPPHMEYEASGSVLKSKLWAIPVDGGFYFLVAGSGVPSDDQIDTWASAVLRARDEAEGGRPEHQWTAVIGPKPSGFVMVQRGLAQPTEIGGMALTPGDVVLSELRPSLEPSFSRSNGYVSEPVRVTGTSHGYDWWRASRSAMEDLHRLCSLLTVLTDRCWVVRDSARSKDWGEIPIPAWLGQPADDSAGQAVIGGDAVTLTDWIEPSYQRARTDVRFANRLSGFHEGSSAQDEHPSLAAVAFVAVIESIGTQLFPPLRCTCKEAQVGYAESFRNALRIVLPENQARSLDASYGTRSKTAHEGQLHGTEAVFGMTGHSFWEAEKGQRFATEQLWRLRGVARRLIEMDCTGSLPAKRSSQSSLRAADSSAGRRGPRTP